MRKNEFDPQTREIIAFGLGILITLVNQILAIILYGLLIIYYHFTKR